MNNKELREMAQAFLSSGQFDEDTDPQGDYQRGAEYIASDGDFDTREISKNVKGVEDWDGLEEWAGQLGQSHSN